VILAQALAIYRKQFVALLLTSGLALLPANALVGGAWVMGLASHVENAEGPPAGDEVEKPPVRRPGRLDPKAPDAHRPEASLSDSLHLRLSELTPLALSLLLAAAVLLAATLLSLAALVPLVLGAAAGPAQAWEAVGARFGAVLATGALSLALTLLGSCLCVVPGAVMAIGFAFALPVTMVEDLRGRRALERAWVLMRAEWPALLAVVVLYIAVVVAASFGAGALLGPGLRQLAGAAVVRLLLLPLALVSLVLLYLRARATVDGQPQEALRAQYIRRISAPG
jgi:hypothetical protein